MAYTLLELVDQATGEMGLAQPAAVIGSANNQVKQLLALCQRLGLDLLRDFEWRRLTKAYIFRTGTATSTTGDTTVGSPNITNIPSTAGLSAGDLVSGTGIPSYAEITSVTSGTAVALNMAASATGTTVALTFTVQDYALAADFDRMVSETQWNRTKAWALRGARTSQEWQAIQGSMVSSLTPENFRIYANKLRLTPAPQTLVHFAYEYISNYWVMATGSTTPSKTSFTVDTDTFIYPDDLMLAGLKYYFLKAKKLDFGIEMAEFNDILSKCKVHDVPAPSLNMTPSVAVDPLGPSISDGSWSL